VNKTLIPRLATVTTGAADAARYTAALSEAAAEPGGGVPLAAYARPALGLAQTAGFLGNCLHYAGPLADAILTLEPAAYAAGEGHIAGGQVREASQLSRRAGDTIGLAFRVLLRDLNRGGDGPGWEAAAEAELLTRRANQARNCLAGLETGLLRAGKAELTGPLPALGDISAAVMRLALAAAFTGQACERFSHVIADAYRRHPAGRRPGGPRPPVLLLSAAGTMQRAAGGTRRAHLLLDAGAERARRAARVNGPAEAGPGKAAAR